MAKSHYNGDSPFPSPFSEYPRTSASSETIPVEPVFVPAVPAIETSLMPATYILSGGADLYIGESDCTRRLRDHGVADPAPRLDRASPSTTSIID